MSLLGKILCDRTIGKDIVQAKMGKIWKVSKEVIFTKVVRNVFTITLSIDAYKLRVLEGRSWLFDN